MPDTGRSRQFDAWVGKISWRRKWQSAPVSLPGKSCGQRSLAGNSPWGHKRVKHDLGTKQQYLLWGSYHLLSDVNDLQKTCVLWSSSWAWPRIGANWRRKSIPLLEAQWVRPLLFHANKVNQQILSHCVTCDGVWPNSNIPRLNMAAASLPPFISGKTFSCDQPESREEKRTVGNSSSLTALIIKSHHNMVLLS